MASASTSTDGSLPGASPNGTVVVGAVLSLTGAGSVYGESEQEGILLAVDEINARKSLGDTTLKVLFEDDASNELQGIDAYQKLINQDGVVALIGPTLPSVAQEGDPIAQQAGVPVLAISLSPEDITEVGDFIFRDSLSESQVLPVVVQAVKRRANPRRAAILYGDDDPFTSADDDVFKQALETSDMNLVAQQGFATGETDFGPQLTDLARARADSVFISAFAPEASSILAQAGQAGLLNVTLVGGSGLDSMGFPTAVGPAGEGVVVGATWTALDADTSSQDFVQSYTARFNSEPDQFAAQAYAGTYILERAISDTNGPPFDRTAVRNALASLGSVPTVLGPFAFTSTRGTQRPVVVQVLQDGFFRTY